MQHWGQKSLDLKFTGCDLNVYVRNQAGSLMAEQVNLLRKGKEGRGINRL